MIIKSYETPVQFLFYQDANDEFWVAILFDGEPLIEFLVEEYNLQKSGLETLLRAAGLDVETVKTVASSGREYFEELRDVTNPDHRQESQAGANKDSPNKTGGSSRVWHRPWSWEQVEEGNRHGTVTTGKLKPGWTDDVSTFDHDPDALDPSGFGWKEPGYVGPGPFPDTPTYGSADVDYPHYPDQRGAHDVYERPENKTSLYDDQP